MPKRVLYLDRTKMKTCTSVFLKDTEIISAGAIVYAMPIKDKNEEYQRFAEEYDIHFIFEDHVPGIDFYTIPMVEIFAVDSAGGYIGSVGQSVDLEQDIPVCYIDKEKKCYLIAVNGKEFLENVYQWKKNLVPYSEIEFLKSLEEAKEKFEFVGSFITEHL